ncbi:acetyl-CoA carboxylase biotin carboxylase subunit [Pseudorhodoplanes sinuspersici]|uniref:Carbamoyl-phosphate synthase subunit L n=1 Tax=Pseudorhodoplanes sinuspersici TaxID=1235591 RepID=A0A1W6ZXH5_9HYPH|nr:acetyl-CoA carboxylase biotin carboxylase subunit [Pseudorhodoplanes sinuspersici]ARQ01455.1 carbamoyl-phosphate synthase subunit L [Pseudorhodoplanes sinuspersici]RKE73145.1 3-methylcrotonyl-CoA carboxylase alpha subunit [Pseudorhodoplanes sinuspersici]
MLNSVLIANRGEIACRIARTAKRLGMRTVAVYSEADAAALHVRLCDEAYLIGPAPARESYLSIGKLLKVAQESRAACIHPGYGFLSENPDFAEACAEAGIVFVGPPPAAIRAMGLKDRAKALMQQAGVPVVPGYHGDQQDANFLKRKAYELGYPILIKAIAGGGGKGMRLVERHADFETAIEAAKREAASAFGDDRVLIEKYISAPRHIEIQIFADKHGSAIHLNERDCSLQRRHQKVIEEAPAPGMTPQLRARMGEAAVAAAKAVGYAGAGTVEFIADGSNGLKADGFWFMEMNTRLQVEHPVTEAVTGFDLVEWQFRVADGKRLPIVQADVPLQGHAIEARLYAEDPERGFLPSTGKLVALSFPQGDGIRIDSGVEQGGEITPYYDPMIAKVIAHADTRTEALNNLARALGETIVAGPRTNLAFLGALCRSADFRDGKFDTGYIAQHHDELGLDVHGIDAGAAARGALHLLSRTDRKSQDETEVAPSPWDIADGFQLSGPRKTILPILINGEPDVAVLDYGGRQSVFVHGAEPDMAVQLVETPGAVYVLRAGRQTLVALRDFEAAEADHADSDGVIRAPMHGKLLAVLVTPGEAVTKGHRLAVIEAMKMEHALVAPRDGVIGDVAAEIGAQLAEGARILSIEPAGTGAA